MGIGFFVGIALAAGVVPLALLGLSFPLYELGIWPLGATFRIYAVIWLSGAFVHMMRRMRRPAEADEWKTYFTRFLWAPIVAPAVLLIPSPLFLLMRPLQLVVILIATAAWAWINPLTAIVLISVFSLWYVWTTFTPPRDLAGRMAWQQTYGDPVQSFSMVILTLVLMWSFLLYFNILAEHHAVLRWLAALALALYSSNVANGLWTSVTQPEPFKLDQAMRRGDIRGLLGLSDGSDMDNAGD